MIFVAQPGAAAEVIDSWLGYIARNHPEMEQPPMGGSRCAGSTAAPRYSWGIRPVPATTAGRGGDRRDDAELSGVPAAVAGRRDHRGGWPTARRRTSVAIDARGVGDQKSR